MIRFIIAGILVLVAPAAHAQSYSDVQQSREDYAAIEDLTERGILEGRPDGTFGPDDFVNRAEAITIVVRAVANVRNLPKTGSCFPDVHGDDWYVQPVCYAKDLGWVAGYPDGTYQPIRTVAKAEFLKIAINAYGIDTDALSDLTDPLSFDLRNSDEWYFPYFRYALASSMTSVDKFGNLNPGIALTRGQVALLLNRLLLYREGVRDQPLLTNAEKDIRLAFDNLNDANVDAARYAVSRAVTTVRGVKMRNDSAKIVSVTTKLTGALSELVRAYELVRDGSLSGALSHAQDAYKEADSVDAEGKDMRLYTDRIRSYSHELANEIRNYQKQ